LNVSIPFEYRIFFKKDRTSDLDVHVEQETEFTGDTIDDEEEGWIP
jgi:hypothetical protein